MASHVTGQQVEEEVVEGSGPGGLGDDSAGLDNPLVESKDEEQPGNVLD